jgi:hypothetical protein
MTAYNVVRMRVKPGHEEEMLADFREERDPELAARMKANGLRKLSIIKTGDRSYCLIGEWDKMSGIVASRPDMIKSLDKHRGMLEDLGGGVGVTDPVSGEVVVEIGACK